MHVQVHMITRAHTHTHTHLQELEQEAVMNELARRTDHKQSLDSEATVGRSFRHLRQQKVCLGGQKALDNCCVPRVLVCWGDKVMIETAYNVQHV
jgi:hypothetical protein